MEILNNKAVEQAKRLEILERKVDEEEGKGWIDHLFWLNHTIFFGENLLFAALLHMSFVGGTSLAHRNSAVYLPPPLLTYPHTKKMEEREKSS